MPSSFFTVWTMKKLSPPPVTGTMQSKPELPIRARFSVVILRSRSNRAVQSRRSFSSWIRQPMHTPSASKTMP